jgi:hypothetical protein
MNIHRHDFDEDRNINVLRNRFRDAINRRHRERALTNYALQAAAIALVISPIAAFGFDWVRDEGVLSLFMVCTFVAGGLIGRSTVGNEV